MDSNHRPADYESAALTSGAPAPAQIQESIPAQSLVLVPADPGYLRTQLIFGGRDMTALGLLILRLVVGLTLAAHGSQKLFGWWGGPGLAGRARCGHGRGSRPCRSSAAVFCSRLDYFRLSAAWRS